ESKNLDLIYTFVKCDICVKNIEDCDTSIIKKCGQCQTLYHISCSKEFGDKNDDRFCKKCITDRNKECLICNKINGSMTKCDNNKWVHIICMLMLKKYFNKKQDGMNTYS